MKNKFCKVIMCMTMVVVALSLSGCEDEDSWFSDIPGRWQLVEIDGRYVDEWDCDYYTFYSDGTGYYTYYDRYGYGYDEDFYWEERTGGRLYITYYDPSWGSVMCYFRTDGRYMDFSETPSFYHYTTYIRL